MRKGCQPACKGSPAKLQAPSPDAQTASNLEQAHLPREHACRAKDGLRRDETVGAGRNVMQILGMDDQDVNDCTNSFRTSH